jgi:hypothetical protein
MIDSQSDMHRVPVVWLVIGTGLASIWAIHAAGHHALAGGLLWLMAPGLVVLWSLATT